MRMMPRLLWLLFGMSVVTMLFIARCGISMDSQQHSNPHMSAPGTPGEKALREVMRRKEVEHVRDRSVLQEKIKSLESQLEQVQNEVKNLTAGLQQSNNPNLQDRGQGSNQNPANIQDVYVKPSLNSNGHANNLRFPIDGLNPVPFHRSHEMARDPEMLIRQQQNLGARYFPERYDLNQGARPADDDRGHYQMLANREENMGVIDRHALGVEDSNNNKGEVRGQAGSNLAEPDNVKLMDNALNFQGKQVGEGHLGAVNISGAFDYLKYFQERLNLAEILRGQSYKTEYELIPFNRFVFNRIYMVEPGLGKRVVEKPIGSKKRDLHEILYHAMESLNKDRSGNHFTYDDFVEGIYRTDPATGSQYELYFANRDEPSRQHSYVKITVVRPFAPPQTVQQHLVNTGPEWINLILPLSKRVDTFRLFMEQFVRVCIKHDKRIYLTVVYFGFEGLTDVKNIMSQVAKANKFKHMKLVTLNDTFARGRGLQIGALNWKGGGDVLLFFCDVDIVFTHSFLERCRLNSERGQRVYYPIVFSLYNPKIVYSLQDVPMPSFLDQLVLSKDTGFWRDFGYGMTCMYRSDFLKIKGFDEEITGWGGEDVFLYQKFVRSDYFVVRATDPAIFHLWHEKVCDPKLSSEQYRSCIRSKALNEASHSQLGLLAFKDEIDIHRGVVEGNRMLNNEANNVHNGRPNGS
ncbi:chondroitin sulfate N-acetylgalactosaminyltransferase 1-like [Biomphalaria glabrata]|uniref:Hexosyltransferase n=1 Tax=Biomphalaria glabrata TaxID=6526 RepID=A0A9W2ZKR5_BIOGL|nr:chondroitin sulfate N-acetylgalactosaminyltransferase 1-like [Biomphalaria glabrata]XP_055875568.1 chondroitin sulfate N-acetylgalactosaminyltransferase 1-like [Biomphalaria glabrata]XP_055875569.1 chondroitin sulfate N-acetylgalactosaminyltransferase 1-like [Biomphalaria glabrata]XP_055875570.1 chondroitin sulfate N-acetylgalactosaminyltransferase 1-like [Biomphalaria glabrata]